MAPAMTGISSHTKNSSTSSIATPTRRRGGKDRARRGKGDQQQRGAMGDVAKTDAETAPKVTVPPGLEIEDLFPSPPGAAVEEKLRERQLVNEASDFVCGICLENVVGCGPVLTRCTHLFCGDCFESWTDTCKDDVSCPCCGDHVNVPDDLQVLSAESVNSTSLVFWRMLSSLKVVCKNHAQVAGSNGHCDWVGEYRDYQEHVQTCQNTACCKSHGHQEAVPKRALSESGGSSEKTTRPGSPNSCLGGSSPEMSEPFRSPLAEGGEKLPLLPTSVIAPPQWDPELGPKSAGLCSPPMWSPRLPASPNVAHGDRTATSPSLCQETEPDARVGVELMHSELPRHSVDQLASLLSEMDQDPSPSSSSLAVEMPLARDAAPPIAGPPGLEPVPDFPACFSGPAKLPLQMLVPERLSQAPYHAPSAPMPVAAPTPPMAVPCTSAPVLPAPVMPAPPPMHFAGPPIAPPPAFAPQRARAGLLCQALQGFRPYEPGMLQVFPADHLEVHDYHNSGWCLCQNLSQPGQPSGWVPNWILPPKPAGAPPMPAQAPMPTQPPQALFPMPVPVPPTAPAPTQAPKAPEGQPVMRMPCAPAPSCVVIEVLKEFVSKEPSLLSVAPKDLIEVTRRDAQGWVYGRKISSRERPEGWFPAWACTN